MVSKAIERAQKQVEAQNFSVSKHLLEYDDVMNKQRESIYSLRREILESKIHFEDEDAGEEIVGTREYLMSLAEGILDSLVETYAAREADYELWDLDALKREATRVFAIDGASLDFADRTSDEIRDQIWAAALASYEDKEKLIGREVLERVERDIMLQIVDGQWKDHLYSLDHLKEGIGLRGYGQRDPLVEYKKESFDLFLAMKERVDEEIVRYLWWLRPVVNEIDGGVAGLPVPPRRPAPVRPAPARQSLIFNNPVRDSRRRLAARRPQRRRHRARRGSSRRASAVTMPPSRPSAATSPRWEETIHARAEAGRNTRSATGRRLKSRA